MSDKGCIEKAFKVNYQRHPGQAEVNHLFKNSTADILILDAARGWGKSLYAVCDLVLPKLMKEPHTQIMWVAPTYKICKAPVDDVWFGVNERTGERFIPQFTDDGLKLWDFLKADMEIRMANSSTVYLRSAENPDCYDDQTEVCTKDGWKKFKDVIESDLILCMDQDTRNLIWSPILAYVAEKYTGPMHVWEDERKKLVVTPNHRILSERRNKKKTHEYIQAQEISKRKYDTKIPTGKYHGGHKEKIHIPGCSNGPLRLGTPDRYLDQGDFCDFIGWYLSEGSSGYYGHNYRISITQKKCEHIEAIKESIRRLGFEFYHDRQNNNILINDKALCIYLQKNCYSHGSTRGAYRKIIPEFVWECSDDSLNRLFTSLVSGDGTRQKSGYVEYYSTSKKLTDQIAVLGSLLGYSCSVKPKDQKDCFIRGRLVKAKDCAPLYQCQLSKEKASYLQPNSTVINYSGMIYCLQTVSGNMMVRYPGKRSFLCGNSIVAKGFSLIIVDEAALIPENVFLIQILATARKAGCKIILISTPRGKNWFYKLFRKGQNPLSPEFASIKQPWWKRPDYPMVLRRLMKTLPEHIRKQEFEAEFIGEGGMVFKNLNNVFCGPPITFQDPNQEWMAKLTRDQINNDLWVIHADLAKEQDYTVIGATSITSRRMAYYYRRNKEDYKNIVEQIRKGAIYYNDADVIYDATGVGSGVGDFLSSDLNAHPYKFTNDSKTALINRLIMGCEYGEPKYPHILTMRDEFEEYTYALTRTGKLSYNAPSGKNDDTVISAALGYWYAKENEGESVVSEADDFLNTIEAMNRPMSELERLMSEDD